MLEGWRRPANRIYNDENARVCVEYKSVQIGKETHPFYVGTSFIHRIHQEKWKFRLVLCENSWKLLFAALVDRESNGLTRIGVK